MSSGDLCTIPAGVSPDGSYNLVDPPSLGPVVIAVGVVLAVISTALGAGRLYTYRNMLQSPDYFTLLACLTNVAFTGIICSVHQLYRHQWDVPACWYTAETFKLSFVQAVLWSPAFFPKAAILLLYRQLFGTDRRTRIAINIGLLVTLLNYLSNIPLAAVYLAPRVGQSWDSLISTTEEHRVSITLGGVVQSSIATLMDFYIFFLPLPILIRLRQPLRRRLQLVGIFSTALLGVGASVVSVVFKARSISSQDSGWLTGIIAMASLIETNIAIIVVCMPSIPQLTTVTIGGSAFFRSLRSRLIRNSGRSANSKSGSDGLGGKNKAPSLVTFGANQTPRRNNYFELSDSALLETHGDTMLVEGAEEEHEMQAKPSSIQREAEHYV
ncbi:hypothetical protein F4821DRAFT_276623 [Hypoxylon rubiginosum]|uniref:Uncharacterized protein n=1 Tax=Hypoxylon rubiginosum TaxID=110542 RepID=A0ACC0CIK0_9PEZI|nr:hypothetical protein F4821DRAFT_276623 [Hypoxylon rubiginosum]